MSSFNVTKGKKDNPKLYCSNKINKEYKIDQNDLTKGQHKLLNERYNETQKGAISLSLNTRLIVISQYLLPYY